MDAILSHPLFLPLVLTALLIGLMPLVVGYLVLAERKVLADLQVRLGPMRAGAHGILQPIADAVKMLLKEDLVPGGADQKLFLFAPVISMATAFLGLAVLPYANWLYVADVNVGVLIISAASGVGILGIVLGGWASNSHYSLLGALRSGAQLISYEVALALGLLAGIMSAGTLSMTRIVEAQYQRGLWTIFDNFGLMIVPFLVYFIAGVAELNRAPFDLPEAESELVAGFHTEYSGFRWGVYMLAEYVSMVVLSGVAVTVYWGGWLRPFPNVAFLKYPLDYALPVIFIAGSGLGCLYLARKIRYRLHKLELIGVGVALILFSLVFLIPAVNEKIIGMFWFLLKVGAVVYALIWFRGTFPRYRYDQLMNLGWKILIPVGLGAILANAVVGMLLMGMR